MNNEVPKINLEQIKKYIIIATIVLVTVCAFLGIIAIFVGSDVTILKLLSTLLIMYLVLLYSTNNIIRLENPISLVKTLSIFALVANFFWSIPWILLVWNAFGGLDTDARITIWKFVGSAAVISVFCTILSAMVAKIHHFPTIIKVFKSLPLVCAGFLGIDLLLVIWIDDMDGEVLWKLFLAEGILVALQLIVTQILINNAARLGINTGMPPSTPPAAPTSSPQEVKNSDVNELPNSQPITQPSAPAPKKYSALTIIGIIVISLIALQLIGGLVSTLLFYAFRHY